MKQQMYDVLKRVKTHFPMAFIAGGALRDLHYGKPVKDVDIFIPLEGVDWDDNKVKVQTVFYQEVPQLNGESIYFGCNLEEGQGRYIDQIFKVTVEGINYDIIFIDGDRNTVVGAFDLSICQIASYGEDEVYKTSAFDKTDETKIITVENINRKDRQKKRIERVKEKYPEFTVQE